MWKNLVMLNEVHLRTLLWREGTDPFGGFPPSRNDNISIWNIALVDGTPPFENNVV